MTSRSMTRKSGAAVTMHAVAAHAGVSPMSVSNVINGRRVLPETRDAVLRAIQALDYKPNMAARALAKAAPVRIGLLYNSPESAFVSALLVGAIDAATRFGAQLMICRYEEGRAVGDIVQDMVDGGANALVLPAPYCEAISGSPVIDLLGVPIVGLCSGSELGDMASVRVDDSRAAHELTTYLIGLGHSRIGFVRGARNHLISRTRLEGYQAALESAGLPLLPALLVDGDLSFESGLIATERLLELPEPPTAIFASNDDMAAAVVSVAHRRDLRVPEQLSVAGFDDSPISRKIWPPLTTVRQPIVEMTAKAVETVIALLGNQSPEVCRPVTTYADFSLVIRQSTGPVSPS